MTPTTQLEEPSAVVLTPEPKRLTLQEILLDAPRRVRDASQKAFDGRAAVDRIVLELKLLEARHMQAVVKKYEGVKSNAEQREADVRDAMSNDPGTLDLRRALDEQKATNHKVEAYSEYWNALQRNARVLLLARSPFDIVTAVEDVA